MTTETKKKKKKDEEGEGVWAEIQSEEEIRTEEIVEDEGGEKEDGARTKLHFHGHIDLDCVSIDQKMALAPMVDVRSGQGITEEETTMEKMMNNLGRRVNCEDQRNTHVMETANGPIATGPNNTNTYFIYFQGVNNNRSIGPHIRPNETKDDGAGAIDGSDAKRPTQIKPTRIYRTQTQPSRTHVGPEHISSKIWRSTGSTPATPTTNDGGVGKRDASYRRWTTEEMEERRRRNFWFMRDFANSPNQVYSDLHLLDKGEVAYLKTKEYIEEEEERGEKTEAEVKA